MHEIEFTHLKKNWVERLIAADVEKQDAYKWVAEIGHVVDEYERSLRFLVDLLQTNDASSAALKLESWVAYTRDMTIWKLGDVMTSCKGDTKNTYHPRWMTKTSFHSSTPDQPYPTWHAV
jgi:hypothetical protein